MNTTLIPVNPKLANVEGIGELLEIADLFGFTVCQTAALVEKLKGKKVTTSRMIGTLLGLAPTAMEFQSKLTEVAGAQAKAEIKDLVIEEGRRVALAGLDSASCVKGEIHELLTRTINYIADTAVAGEKAYKDGTALVADWQGVFAKDA